MNITVTAIFTDETNAEHAISELLQAGVSTEDLSYISAVDNGVRRARGVEASGREGKRRGVIGAIDGVIVTSGTVSGLGSVVVAGPLAGILGLTDTPTVVVAGATATTIMGGFAGVLTGLGIAREDTETYEEYVRIGDTLVLVTVHDLGEVSAVKEILSDYDANEVRSYTAGRVKSGV